MYIHGKRPTGSNNSDNSIYVNTYMYTACIYICNMYVYSGQMATGKSNNFDDNIYINMYVYTAYIYIYNICI